MIEKINQWTGTRVKLKSGETKRCRVLVGADGARSAVAAALQLGVPSYAGYSAYRSPSTKSIAQIPACL